MEDKTLEMCKKVINGETPNDSCTKIGCSECLFGDEKIDCGKYSMAVYKIARNYIKEHEKTVNTIEKIEEKHKYKVGDKVRVKSDLKANDVYGGVRVNRTMAKSGNEILTIEKIWEYKNYIVKENRWLWSEEMLEPVEENEEKNEDISRDLIEGNNFTKATVTLKELQEIKNNVVHPQHYTNGKYECINVIEDVTKDLSGLEAVCTANVIKYMWRWKLKNGVEDLKKARWYLNKLIDNTEIREIEDTYQSEGMAD